MQKIYVNHCVKNLFIETQIFTTYYGGLNDEKRCSLLEHDVQIYHLPLHKMANSHRTAETRRSVIYGLRQLL